jgi:hypothetical protein
MIAPTATASNAAESSSDRQHFRDTTRAARVGSPVTLPSPENGLLRYAVYA